MNQQKKSSLKLFIYLSVLLHLGAGAVYYFNRQGGSGVSLVSDKTAGDPEPFLEGTDLDSDGFAEESGGIPLTRTAETESVAPLPPPPPAKAKKASSKKRASGKGFKKPAAQSRKPPGKAFDSKTGASVSKKKQKAGLQKKKRLSAGKPASDKTAGSPPTTLEKLSKPSPAPPISASSAAPQEDFIIGEFNLPDDPEENPDSLDPQSSLAEGENSEQTAAPALPDFSNKAGALPSGADPSKPDPTELDSIKLDPAEANALPQSVSLSETEEIANLSLLNNQNELPGFSSLDASSSKSQTPDAKISLSPDLENVSSSVSAGSGARPVADLRTVSARAEAALARAGADGKAANQTFSAAGKAGAGGSPSLNKAVAEPAATAGGAVATETPATAKEAASHIEAAPLAGPQALSSAPALPDGAPRAAGDGPLESTNGAVLPADSKTAAPIAAPALDSPALPEAPPDPPEAGEGAVSSQPAVFRQASEEAPVESAVSFKNFSDLRQRSGNPALNYPKKARQTKAQGSLAFIFYVTEQGLVEKIQLKSSSGHRDLDNSVLRTFARYKFQPGQSGWVRHTVEFHLKGEETELLKLREK